MYQGSQMLVRPEQLIVSDQIAHWFKIKPVFRQGFCCAVRFGNYLVFNSRIREPLNNNQNMNINSPKYVNQRNPVFKFG
jgi:hypothetical protein